MKTPQVAHVKTVEKSKTARTRKQDAPLGPLLIGTGLAFASLILVPAIATQVGLGTSLTGALRIALMKASSRAIRGSGDGAEAATMSFSCH
ncbi:hypothetical protein [Methylococcus capsulatus]|uniref:hypothetical protein n=1 Tax=Methylococcus capsulatus TaxID=414 RepID=UPI0006823973|nr:hypothetical protein [Methylococcus capsulatus]